MAILLVPAQLRAERYDDFGPGEQEIIGNPTPELFSVCFNHSCDRVESHSITRQEWALVTSPLDTPRESAVKERRAIAAAIAIIEEIVGQRTGTGQDLGGNLRGFGKTGQMDCIDESTNTTTYLTMLDQGGYLKWHKPVDRSTRFGIFVGMPHTTAVIEELGSHTRYAVDSWFYDNGTPPAIVKLPAWKKGWNPDDPTE